jgi:hypothetical protein
VARELKLECSRSQFHELWAVVNATRLGSETVRVNAVALRALLGDHTKLVSYANSLTSKTTEPE